MTEKRFAIFDMDGTLVDSMPWWNALAGEYLAGKGISVMPPDLAAQVESMTTEESAALFVEAFGLPETAEAVAAEMNAVMENHYREDVSLRPGVEEHLRKLRADGVRMCVASSTAHPLMEACLRRLGIRDYFAFLLSCEEAGAGKDRPDVYLAAAARLGAEPPEVAVYEDALYAAETAKAAGFYVVGVYEESAAAQWEALKKLADAVMEPPEQS